MMFHTPILVVDDDLDIREAVSTLLADGGYRHVEQAKDGLEAFLILQLSPEPMVTVCDYRMPRLDGFRLLRALQGDGPRLRRHGLVPMTTASNLLSTAHRRFLRRHAIPVVRKPFDLDRLLQAVAQAAERVRRQSGAVKANALGA